MYLLEQRVNEQVASICKDRMDRKIGRLYGSTISAEPRD